MRREIQWEKLDKPPGADSNRISRDEFEEDDEHVFDLLAKDGDTATIEMLPVIPTGTGYIPLKITNGWGDNFYVGNTTFNLSRESREIIKKVPGVEIVDVSLRYTFGISVAKCFKAPEVQEAIEEALMAPRKLIGEVNKDNIYLPPEERQRVKAAIEKVHDKFPQWTVCLLQNGAIDAKGFTDEEEEEFCKALDLHHRVFEAVGGILYRSDADEASK